jgi:hypothetical protein
MGELALYEAARHALAEARRVDEVALIRNKSVAMQTYAAQAKDRTLIAFSTEIRMRAEIKAGEMLAAMKASGERQTAGGNRGIAQSRLARLADLGVSRSQSCRWQKLAALPPREQEAQIERAKKKAEAGVTSAVRVDTAAAARRPLPQQPIDRCAKSVRMAVRGTMREMPPSQWAGLFAALRDVLAELEKAADRRRNELSRRFSADAVSA